MLVCRRLLTTRVCLRVYLKSSCVISYHIISLSILSQSEGVAQKAEPVQGVPPTYIHTYIELYIQQLYIQQLAIHTATIYTYNTELKLKQ